MHSNEESRSFDDIEKVIYTKACGYCFLVYYTPEGKIGRPVGFFPKGARKNAKYMPVSSFPEFLGFWVQKELTDKEAHHLMVTLKYDHKAIFMNFFKGNPTVQFLDYVKHLENKDDKPEDKEFKDSLPAEVLGSLKEYLDNKSYIFLHFIYKERTAYEILLLDNPETNTYNILGQSTDKDLPSLVLNAILSSDKQEIQNWFKGIINCAFGKFKSKRDLVKTVLDLLLPSFKYHLDSIETVSNDPNVPNFNYLDLNSYEIVPGEDYSTPSWDAFLNLFQDQNKQEIFKAWVWSVFDENNKGRQWLWIKGPGNDGKSTMIKAITNFMDRKFGAGKMYASANSNSHKNTFFYSNVYSKRLVVFGDNKERSLLSMEEYKRLSGGDLAPIEAKYARAFAGKIYSKILVGSNYFPYVNFWDDSEVTRAIVLDLDTDACNESKRTRANEAAFGLKLDQEFEKFLAKCRSCYEMHKKPGAHDLILPSSVVNAMKANCSSEESNVIPYFMHTCLEFDTKSRVRAATLYTKFDLYCEDSISPNKILPFRHNLVTALGKLHGCFLDMRTSPSGVEAQYMIGCRLKSSIPKSYASVLREEDAMDMTDGDEGFAFD